MLEIFPFYLRYNFVVLLLKLSCTIGEVKKCSAKFLSVLINSIL